MAELNVELLLGLAAVLAQLATVLRQRRRRRELDDEFNSKPFEPGDVVAWSGDVVTWSQVEAQQALANAQLRADLERQMATARYRDLRDDNEDFLRQTRGPQQQDYNAMPTGLFEAVGPDYPDLVYDPRRKTFIPTARPIRPEDLRPGRWLR